MIRDCEMNYRQLNITSITYWNKSWIRVLKGCATVTIYGIYRDVVWAYNLRSCTRTLKLTEICWSGYSVNICVPKVTWFIYIRFHELKRIKFNSFWATEWRQSSTFCLTNNFYFHRPNHCIYTSTCISIKSTFSKRL